MIESVNSIEMMVSLLIGALVGFIYFFGLWLTLKQLPLSKYPGLLMLSSLLLRMALVMAVFYTIMRSTGWQGLLVALLGLTLVRFILSRRYKPEPVDQSSTLASASTVKPL